MMAKSLKLKLMVSGIQGKTEKLKTVYVVLDNLGKKSRHQISAQPIMQIVKANSDQSLGFSSVEVI